MKLLKALGPALAVAAVLMSNPASAMDKVTFRMNWYYGGFHSPFHLGLQRGYYKDEGIDLTLNEGRGSANTVQTVAAGSDDFGVADSSSVMLLAAKGADVKTVMTIHANSAFGVISLAETGIKQPKDLEGKRMAISAGDALTQLFPAFAKSAGIDRSKISLVQIDPAGKVVALLEKRVDAIIGGLDDQYFLVKQKGANPVGMKFADHGANTVGLTIVTSDAFAKKNPDLVKRFLRATTRAWQEAIKNPDAAVDALLKARPDLDRTSQKGQLEADISFIASPASKGKPFGYNAPQDWERTMKILTEYRDLKTDKPASAFYSNDYLPKE
ncbi:MAG: ABC transporter substrate-binding protein [Pseudolabrys sp.]|jgi:NitT/TauT family transport system substrate-binding protein